MKWYPVELHTHTEHSDGDFTPTQLVQAAKARGFAGVALTDHNTKSGTTEFNAAIEKNGLTGVHGIEWTTYWGHMLVLGEYTYTDWRGVTPDMIDEAIKRIHDHCGLVGIAHPFATRSIPVTIGSSRLLIGRQLTFWKYGRVITRPARCRVCVQLSCGNSC